MIPFHIIAIKTSNKNYFNQIKSVILNNIPNIKVVDNKHDLIFNKKNSNILFYDEFLSSDRIHSYLKVASDLHNMEYSIIELESKENYQKNQVININNGQFIRLLKDSEANLNLPIDIISDKQLLNEIILMKNHYQTFNYQTEKSYL